MKFPSQFKKSNQHEVTLRNIDFAAEGPYCCEVSLESPIFTKASNEEQVHVFRKFSFIIANKHSHATADDISLINFAFQFHKISRQPSLLQSERSISAKSSWQIVRLQKQSQVGVKYLSDSTL